MMKVTETAGGILLTMEQAALPVSLADPIRSRWMTDEDDDTVDQLIEKAAGIACPSVFLRPAHVDSIDRSGEIPVVLLDGYPVKSALAAEKLHTPGQLAVGYVMTCGRAMYDAIGTLGGDFFAEAIWDELMIACLRIAGSMMHEYAEARFFPKKDGKKSFSSLNPGSLAAWPIEGQTELFALLGDGAAAAGVKLTPSMLMLPTKSGSGILFATDEPYENCMFCPRIDCPNRRAPYKAGDGT